MRLSRFPFGGWLCFHPALVLGQTVLIRDVRVFDGEKVMKHRNVLVRDGKVD